MRTRTKWLIAGGAAAFVITPVAAVSWSTTLDDDLPQSGLVIDAQAVSKARPSATASATAKAKKKSTPDAKPSGKATVKEPSGKKTVPAASPVSPQSAASPPSPN